MEEEVVAWLVVRMAQTSERIYTDPIDPMILLIADISAFQAVFLRLLLLLISLSLSSPRNVQQSRTERTVFVLRFQGGTSTPHQGFGARVGPARHPRERDLPGILPNGYE